MCRVDTDCQQQQLKAHQPLFTAKIILPLLFTVGLIFIPLSIAIIYTSTTLIGEVWIDYTECRPINLNTELDIPCSQLISSHSSFPPTLRFFCRCLIQFELDQPLKGQVYLHYGLSGFYQSHRRYFKSYDSSQLSGRYWRLRDLSGDCEPFMGRDGRAYTPCGAIANSLFNDSVSLLYLANQSSIRVPVTKSGINWYADTRYVFSNPPAYSGDRNESDMVDLRNSTTAPPYWSRGLYQLDPRGYLNEDLIVWMCPAAFPNFRKLYRIVNHTDEPIFEEGLPAGTYVLDIEYTLATKKLPELKVFGYEKYCHNVMKNYRMLSFNGRRKIILSNTSRWLGGRNTVLGTLYLIAGIASTVSAVFLLVIYIKQKSRLEELLTDEMLNDSTPYY